MVLQNLKTKITTYSAMNSKMGCFMNTRPRCWTTTTCALYSIIVEGDTSEAVKSNKLYGFVENLEITAKRSQKSHELH